MGLVTNLKFLYNQFYLPYHNFAIHIKVLLAIFSRFWSIYFLIIPIKKWQYEKFMLPPSILINGVLLEFYVCRKYHNSSNMALKDFATYKILYFLKTTFECYI